MVTTKSPALDAAHIDELVRSSGISEAVAISAGLYSETDIRALAKLTRTPRDAWTDEHVPALVFPYRLPDRGAEPVVWRVKPRTPIALGRGETTLRKYLHPSNAELHLYFPPSLLDERRRRDTSTGLIVTEGEKKTLAAETAGIACIGLSGVSCWSRKRTSRGPRELHDDWKYIELRERHIAIVFDSDAATTFEVRREEKALAEALQRAGAHVRIVRLPPSQTGAKQGLDDFLVAHGAAALRELVQRTKVLGISPEVQRQIARTQAPSAGAALTDLGNAERLVARHGADMRFVEAWGAWFVWDGMHWKRDETGEATRRAIDTVRAMYAEAAQLEDADARRALVDHATKSESARRIQDALRLARALAPVPVEHGAFDREQMLLNVENGTLDLRTGELREHRREDMCTKLVRVPYYAAALCPTWDAFLRRVLHNSTELIDFVRRAVGYSLTGSVQEQVLFFLYGTGANGKTTFINTLLTLLGDYGHQTAPTLLFDTRFERHPAEVADLQSVRFAACVEAKPGTPFDEGLLKRITGGDRIAARRMRENWYTFTATHKIWFAANHKPPIRHQDEGIWRRIRLIPFVVQIPPEERDPNLEAKLRRELPGILAWAVRGALEWQSGGLRAPPEVVAATAEYREESDRIGPFLDTCCVLRPTATTWAKDLWDAYLRWCEQVGERPVSQNTFARRLAEAGCQNRKSHGRIRWDGVGLMDHRWDALDEAQGRDGGGPGRLSIIATDARARKDSTGKSPQSLPPLPSEMSVDDVGRRHTYETTGNQSGDRF